MHTQNEGGPYVFRVISLAGRPASLPHLPHLGYCPLNLSRRTLQVGNQSDLVPAG